MLPRGKRTSTQRGGRTRSVATRLFDSETVGMPAASISRWTSPPDWWQIGQTGTTRAASTPSSRMRVAMVGAVTMARSSARTTYPIVL